MTERITREEFKTVEGRKRAWRELMLGDHGIIRKFYDNTHEIAPSKLWRTYQPSPAKLVKWQARGVKTVINLRGDKPSGFYFLEEEACQKLGLDLITFRVFSRDAPSKEILHGARQLFQDVKYPAIMHCKSGADRVGLMSVLYLYFFEHRPLKDALQHLTFRYGHVRQGKTGVIDYAFQQFIDYAATENKNIDDLDDFFHWVDNVYDPVAVKKDFLGSWWGNLLTEKILRRE